MLTTFLFDFRTVELYKSLFLNSIAHYRTKIHTPIGSIDANNIGVTVTSLKFENY